MHAPRGIDVEDVQELVAPSGVVVAADGGEEFRDGDVCADDRVEDPLEAEIGSCRRGGGEGVEAADGDGVGRGEASAGEEAEESRFACAVGWGEGD